MIGYLQLFSSLNVIFLPDNVKIFVSHGENLIRAANAAGIHINASCGAEGVCGKCRVIIKKGEVKSRTEGNAIYWEINE